MAASTATLPSVPSDEGCADDARKRTKSKIKYAIVCGYEGTNYFGLQMNSPKVKSDIESTEKILHKPTIEANLENAIYQAGYIRDSNHQQLDKIGWSRSSRTDKGVHAARIIVSAKLEVDNGLEAPEPPASEIARRISEHLPSDIKVFSCSRVNGGFQARNAVHWREYEYLLPTSMLTSSTHENIDVIKEKLNQSLKKYLGSHSFHNFHRLNNRSVMRPNDFDDNEPEEESDDETRPSPPPRQSKMKEDPDFSTLEKLFDEVAIERGEYPDHWRCRHRAIAPKTYSSVYLCEVADLLTINDQPFFKIIIRGKSFLLQ